MKCNGRMGLFKGCNESERFVRIDDENMIISVAGRSVKELKYQLPSKDNCGGKQKGS
jgi:hypothetical protein